MPPAANATIADVKYAFTYEGGVVREDRILNTLKHTGPLFLAKEHLVAGMLPEVVTIISGSTDVNITVHEMHSLVFEGVLSSADLANCGVHFSAKGSRLAKLVSDLDKAGFDWSPIGGPAEVAIPKARKRFTEGLFALPTDQRIFEEDDMLWDLSLIHI